MPSECPFSFSSTIAVLVGVLIDPANVYAACGDAASGTRPGTVIVVPTIDILQCVAVLIPVVERRIFVERGAFAHPENSRAPSSRLYSWAQSGLVAEIY